MPTLTPVDYDPFAKPGTGQPAAPHGMFDDLIPNSGSAGPTHGVTLTPVDHDPFATAPPTAAAPAPHPAGAFDDLIPAPVSTPVDVAESAGTGLVKGGTGLVGMFGDAQAINRNAAHWLMDKAGVAPEGSNSRAAADWLINAVVSPSHSPSAQPTSAQINAGAESAGVPYHTPQTTAGRYAQTAGEFAPGALIGPGGIARKAVADVLIPAALSETAGEVTQGTPYEAAARFAGAGASNLTSALSRSYQTAVPRMVADATHGMTPAQFDAARTVQETGARIGVPLSGPEAVQQATNAGTKLGDLQRIVESSRGGGPSMAQFYSARPDQVRTAAGTAFDAIAPASASPSMLGPQAADLASRSIDEVRQGINTATRPAYAAAEQHLVPSADFDPIARNPAFQASLERLRQDPVLGPQYANLPDNSGAVIDAVTKDMTARATALGNAANPGFQPQTSAAYASGAGDARDILRDPARGGTQAYDDALTMQAQARRQNLEPLEAGPLGGVSRAGTTQAAYDALLPSKPLTGGQYDIGTAVSRLAAQDPVVAATLLRQGVADRFDQSAGRLIAGDNQAGGAKFVKDIAGTDQQRANLEAAFGGLPTGPQARAAFGDLLPTLEATGKRKAPGSNTSGDTGFRQEMSVAPMPYEGAKAALSLGTTIPRMIAERSQNFWVNRRAGSLADLFLAPDSVDQMASLAAHGRETPFWDAFGRSMLTSPAAYGR